MEKFVSFNIKLNISFYPTLVITPQIRTSIKILSMNQIELQATISKELNENPILYPSRIKLLIIN